MRLDFEFTGVLHLFMSPKKSEKLWTIGLKNASSLEMDLEIFTGSRPRKQEISLLEEMSSLTRTLMGFGNLRTKAEPLYIYDDDEEKKDAQGPTEEVKESSGEISALKKGKEVQLC